MKPKIGGPTTFGPEIFFLFYLILFSAYFMSMKTTSSTKIPTFTSPMTGEESVETGTTENENYSTAFKKQTDATSAFPNTDCPVRKSSFGSTAGATIGAVLVLVVVLVLVTYLMCRKWRTAEGKEEMLFSLRFRNLCKFIACCPYGFGPTQC